jgi:hypothetical protein
MEGIMFRSNFDHYMKREVSGTVEILA